jgi:DNA-binding IclR family transcriptional regulator
MAKIHNDIKKLLAEKPMSLVEIAETLEKSEKKTYNALKKLFSNGDIESDPKTRTYSLAKK